MKLTGRYLEISGDLEHIQDYFAEHNLSDGLPIVPPTPERVVAMLRYTDLEPDQVIGLVPPRWGSATVEKIATNAVMAGCKPEYFPVIVAGVRAVSTPAFNLHTSETSTGAHAQMFIVNGPIRRELDINCGSGLLGPGFRANATIGRALRLVIVNIGGSIPGVTSMSTHSQPAKYSCCIGEHEERSPWSPLHVDRGFDSEVSTVTAVSTRGSYDVLCISNKPERILSVLAGSVQPQGNANVFFGGEPMILLCPEWADILAESGLSKRDVQRYVYENSMAQAGTIPSTEYRFFKSWRAGEFSNPTPETMVPYADSPQHVLVIIAGGPGDHSTHIPTLGGMSISQTVPIARRDGTPIRSVQEIAGPREGAIR